MTATPATIATEKKQEEQARISWTAPVLFVLGGVMLIAYFFLPWVSGPEQGNVTALTLVVERGANELDIERNGLALIPMAGLLVMGVSLWSLANPKYDRVAALLTFLGGLLGLVYYPIFFSNLPDGEINALDSVGIGFWLGLLVSVLLVAQALVPRQKYAGYEISKVFSNQESVLALSLIVLVIVVGIINPRFLSNRNLSDVIQGNAYIAIAAIGMSMVIITGNIDISVGSLIGALAVISGRIAVDWTLAVDAAVATQSVNPDSGELLKSLVILVAWLAPLVLGMLVGALIGFLVTYLRVPSIVVTLGMLSIIKGLLIIVTSGQRVVDIPPAYFLAQMRPLGLPTPILFMIILTIVAALWMRYTAIGRALYAVGGNPEAARLSGISPRRVIMTAFIINGFFVGIASVLFASQLTIIQATTPPNLELFIITASVVGGVSILGGTGTVIGSTLAALLLSVIRSGLTFIGVSQFWTQAVQGVLILATVLADLLRRRRQV